jgi:hypothetical protein
LNCSGLFLTAQTEEQQESQHGWDAKGLFLSPFSSFGDLKNSLLESLLGTPERQLLPICIGTLELVKLLPDRIGLLRARPGTHA